MKKEEQAGIFRFPAVRLTRLARVLGAVAVAAAVAACSMETVTSPVSDARGVRAANVLPGSERLAWGLARTTPIARPLIARARFTAKGGTLVIKELGVTLTVPANALPRDTMTITMTALPGAMVVYEFEPHGTVFRRPLTLSHTLKGTKYDPTKDGRFGGHFTDRKKVNDLKKQVLITETASPFIANGRINFNIGHFSGWMMSTGFADDGM
jgi:hypothetical protein